MVKTARHFIRLALLPPAVIASWLALGLGGCSKSDADLIFFKGKAVTIVVPHGPGGMDTYARAIAPYFQKYLPGSKVEVVNSEGAGGITGRNEVFAAKPDGLTLGFSTSAGSLLAEWAAQPGVGYRTADFAQIGRLNAEAHVMVLSPRSGLKGLGDVIRAGRIRMGFGGVGSDDYYVGLIAAKLLGYEVEANTGYSSSIDAGLACVKGEVDAILFSESSVRPLIEAGTVLPVAVFGLVRLGSLPLVPTIFEGLTADRKAVMLALVRIYALDRTLFGPPGMAPGRLAVLRRALDAVMVDPEFQHDMVALKRPMNYLTGSETESLLKEIFAAENGIRPQVLALSQGTR
jgi:tripartite-type tricarboxylate transporter receptor subunit TctC